MKPPICPVCHQYSDCAYIKFADYQPLPINAAGHPNGYECFCQTHDHLARQFAHLSSFQAIEIIKQTYNVPETFISTMMYPNDKKQFSQENFVPPAKPARHPQTVVFQQQQNRAALSATLFLLFSIAMLFMPVIGFLITLNSLKLRSGGIMVEDITGFLAFLLLGLAGAGLFGYLSYRGFKLANGKEPRLILDSAGFSDLTLGNRRIFWRDIKKMKIISCRARYTTITFYFIRMSLNQDSDYKRNTFVLKRFFRKIAFAGYDLEIPISYLHAPESTVLAYFEDFYKKFGAPNFL